MEGNLLETERVGPYYFKYPFKIGGHTIHLTPEGMAREKAYYQALLKYKHPPEIKTLYRKRILLINRQRKAIKKELIPTFLSTCSTLMQHGQTSQEVTALMSDIMLNKCQTINKK